MEDKIDAYCRYAAQYALDVHHAFPNRKVELLGCGEFGIIFYLPLTDATSVGRFRFVSRSVGRTMADVYAVKLCVVMPGTLPYDFPIWRAALGVEREYQFHESDLSDAVKYTTVEAALERAAADFKK